VICGDGAHRAVLERHAAERKLSNVHFLPLLPEIRFRELLVDADVCVISQQPGSGRCFFPSKLLKALAFSRPIFAVAEDSSELADAVREGAFGIVAAAKDAALVARELETMITEPDALQAYGRAGFKFVKRFEQSTLLDAFSRELERVHGEQR
jgi:colanic acid biosynthesis glycosyl transferase WcaI